MLSERFDDAFRFAHQLHRDQRRKGTSIPYVSHLMTVSALVVEHGGDENQAIAALLHDAAEDQGGVQTLDDIRATSPNLAK
jgi:(p)ppGpp synthase/HD superfamily hydrolase